MSSDNPLRIYVTHAYQEHEEYARVFEYLESRDNFFYVNCSEPDHRPGEGQDAVEEHLRNQIELSEVVIFPVGMHAQDTELFDFQLRVAQVFKKPILAIKAFGDTVMLPAKAMEMAKQIVEWNDRVITDAVKSLARGSDPGASDIIEFDMTGIDIPEIPK